MQYISGIHQSGFSFSITLKNVTQEIAPHNIAENRKIDFMVWLIKLAHHPFTISKGMKERPF